MAYSVRTLMMLSLLATGIFGDHLKTDNELDNELDNDLDNELDNELDNDLENDPEFLQRPNFFVNELALQRCMAKGGVCKHSTHCLQSLRDTQLCGSSDDIVCCVKLPGLCRAQGGECLPRGECGGGRHAPVFLDAECEKPELGCCVRTP